MPDTIPDGPGFYYAKGGMMEGSTFRVGAWTSLCVNKCQQG